MPTRKFRELVKAMPPERQQKIAEPSPRQPGIHAAGGGP